MTAVVDSPAVTEHYCQLGPFTLHETVDGPEGYRLELTGPGISKSEPVVFATLDEVSMALNVSDARLDRDTPASDIAAAVAAGVRQVGRGVICALAACDRALNLREFDGGLTETDRQAKAEIWSSTRERVCTELATRISPRIREIEAGQLDLATGATPAAEVNGPGEVV